MRVFISWSGEKSRRIGEKFQRWLPGVIQAVRPYFSPEDTVKGTRWNAEIAKELDVSKVGILMITPENMNAPWLNFEAGALSKKLIDVTKVCPILFGLEPTDVTGPLEQFQAAKFDKEDISRVLKMINGELGEQSLSSEVLASVYEMWWPKLQKDIQEEKNIAQIDDMSENIRTDRDMLEEILNLTRQVARDRGPAAWRPLSPKIPSVALEDLERSYRVLRQWSKRDGADPELTSIVETLGRPLDFILELEKDRRIRNTRMRDMEEKLTLTGVTPRSEVDRG